MIVSLALWLPLSGFCQQTPASGSNPAAKPAAAAPEAGDEAPLPGDWGPELLYGILSSPNEEAQFALLRATFAAGPAIVPQLVEALKDDRTAEFAAQSLAYIGGEKALDALWTLLKDPRDLNLRRFTYGALAEYESPEATNVLMDVIKESDSEPDRTVTETAVIALTAHTDLALLPRLKETESKLQDVVIRDDLDNARAVIEARAKYLASPGGKKAGGSVEAAVRTYFMPALEVESPPKPVVKPPSKAAPQKGRPAAAPVRTEPKPAASVDIQNVTLTPDKNRALARVVFEDPAAKAYYDIILQKIAGNWTIASIWLGPEVQKSAPPSVTSPTTADSQ